MYRLLCVVLPVTAFLGSACGQRRVPTAALPVHLVIDAGSSGTRFCLYSIQAEAPGSCKANPVDALETCIKVPAPNGLADLNHAGRLRVLEQGLKLARARAGRALDGVVLLGTGGFRRLSSIQRRSAQTSIEQILTSLAPGGSLRIISGPEEGELAWHSVLLRTGVPRFTTLETGGATVQIAGKGPKGIQAASFPLGQNAAFREASVLPGFSACLAGPEKKADSFLQCRGLVRAVLGPIAALASAPWSRAEPLFGLGSSWDAIFSMAGRESLTLADIDVLGNKMCTLSIEGTVSSGIPLDFASRTCFLISVQRETLAATGHLRIRRGYESWPRGAAASGQYFRLCRR